MKRIFFLLLVLSSVSACSTSKPSAEAGQVSVNNPPQNQIQQQPTKSNSQSGQAKMEELKEVK